MVTALVPTRGDCKPALDPETFPVTDPLSCRPLLVWDGDCGFCEASVDFLIKRASGRFESVTYQTADLVQLGLTEIDCQKAAQWLGPTGRASGSDAIAHAFLLADRPWRFVGRLLLHPTVRPIATFGYSSVAKSRSRISRFLGLTACRIESD